MNPMIADSLRQAYDYMNGGIQASGGINSIYALISSICVMVVVIIKEFRDTKKFRGLDSMTAQTMTSIDNKFTKLFLKSDDFQAKLPVIETKIEQLRRDVDNVSKLNEEIKLMAQEIKEIQISLQRLIVIQEQWLKMRERDVKKIL